MEELKNADELKEAIIAFLESHGWNVYRTDFIGVRYSPDNLEYNDYEFFMNFTGARQEEKRK